jgi:hypothetical protein
VRVWWGGGAGGGGGGGCTGGGGGGGARFSAPVQTGPGTHPASWTMGTGSFPGGKERPRLDADPSPASSAVSHERLELYHYSPYGPYGLYRASVPVQGCTLLYLFTLFIRDLFDSSFHNTGRKRRMIRRLVIEGLQWMWTEMDVA